MKAAIRSSYGPPEVISIREIAKPIPGKNELLIKVHATTVNRTDCAILLGKPFAMRLFTGLLKPSRSITGTDFAGEVESVGEAVSKFRQGDKVMGFAGFGLNSHAQYLVINESKAIVLMPENLDYTASAACIEGAFYALDCIRMVKPAAGQNALVYGATGAIGSSMVQLLKAYEVHVTAVCPSRSLDLVYSLGANKIINYEAEDFTKESTHYDFVFDAVGKTSFAVCKKLLKEKGIFVSTEPKISELLRNAFSSGKKVKFRPPKNIQACLAFISGLAHQGKFKPVIDRIYPMEQIAEAFTYVASGQKTGNVIIQMH